jgi:flagellar motility protein MotE (MotC chaperone)
MNRDTLIRALIVVKVVLILAFIGNYLGWFYIGDRELSAASSTEGAMPDKGQEVKEKPVDVAANTETSGDGAKVERRSFLDGILNLPEIDPEKVKKDELGKYLGLLEDRKAVVDERVKQLKQREDDLVSLEKSVEVKILKLEEERKFFAETLQKEKDLKSERLDKLVTLYAKMEPKKAAPLFEKMDRDLAVALFKEMKQKQITAILENMKPESSVQLSEYYGRVRSTREYEVLKEMNASLRDQFQNCKGMPEKSG